MRFIGLVLSIWLTSSLAWSSKPTAFMEQDESVAYLNVPIHQFLEAPRKYVPELHTASTLVLKDTKSSLTSTHYTWEQYIHGVPLLGAYLTCHSIGSNRILLQYRLLSVHFVITPVAEGTDAYWAERSVAIPVTKTHLPENRTEYRRVWDGEIVCSSIQKHAVADSLITRVFQPNPILSAEEPYGPPYVDNNDSNNQALMDELFWVQLPANRLNDTLTLADTQFITREISIPTVPVPKVVGSDTLKTDRSQSDFEQLNVFFHLIKERAYLNGLGFEHLMRDTLYVDAQSGFSDNSFFFVSNTDGTRNLEFGTGGVDDGEDADVIIHEYGHYLLEQAVGWKPILTGDAAGINEGNCDYLAKSYALTYSNFQADKLYTWDGNAFGWEGVQVRNNKTYEEVSGNLLNDREIWVRPWFCIYDELGRETTDSLFLEHLSYFTTNISMPTAARSVLQVDTALFNAKHAFTIRKCFCESKMLTPSECAVSVEPTPQTEDLKVLNSAGFRNGTGQLTIQVSGSEPIDQVEIIDIQGREVIRFHPKGLELSIDPEHLTSGIYFALVYWNNGVHSVKVIR